MLFEQTGGNVPAWVQSVLLGADVVLSMNYIVCVLISALHDPRRSEDHLFSGIFFVITVYGGYCQHAGYPEFERQCSGALPRNDV